MILFCFNIILIKNDSTQHFKCEVVWFLTNKLKYGMKNGTEVTLNLSSNLIRSYNLQTNFPHKLSLTDTQVSKICKGFANGSLANIKVSKTQLSKMIQSGKIVIRDLSIFRNILSSAAKKGTDIARSLWKDFLDKQIDKFNKEYITGEGSGITLSNNEKKDIMIKLITSLEIKEIL